MAITATHLTTANGGSATTVYTTASIAPTANNLVVVTILGSSGTPGKFNTVTGAGMTWTKLFDKQAVISTARWINVFYAMSNSPGSGALTLTSSTTQGDAYWSISQFANVDTNGTNGDTAIKQASVNDDNGTISGLTVNLGNLLNANNIAYGVVFWGGGATITKGASFTQLFEGSISVEAESQWALNQSSVPWTWASATNWSQGMAIEISQPRNASFRQEPFRYSF